MNADTLAPARARGLGTVEKALLAISVVGSAVYFFADAALPHAVNVVVKGLGVGPLALLVFRILRGRDGLILGVSLCFSCLGDVFLGIDSKRLFVFGLGSFLVAHLLYVVLFIRNFPRPMVSGGGQKLLVVVLLLYSSSMLAWLWPDLDGLKAPVTVYIGAITAMGVAAALAEFSSGWIVTGAMLFIISDSIIAVGKFKSPIPLSGYLIWGTYYVGQFLIAMGYLREKGLGR